MGLLEDLEKKYGVQPPSGGSELERMEAKYGILPATPAPVRGLQTSDNPPERGIEGVPPALQAGASGAEAAGRGAPAPTDSGGPVHDPALDYWGQADRIVGALSSDGGRSYTDESRRRAGLLNKIENAPDDTVMFEGPRGPITAGHMRALKEVNDVGRQVAAAATVGGAAAKVIGAGLPAGGSAVAQVVKHAIAGGGGAAAGQAVGDMANGVPLEQIPRRAAETGAIGAGFGAGAKISADLLREAEGVARNLRAKQAFRDTGIGATPRQQAQLVARKPEIVSTLEQHDLIDSTDKAAKLKPAAAEKLQAVGEAIGNVDKRVTEASGGVPITKVMRAIDKVAQEHERPGSHEIAAKLQKLAEEVRADWKDKFPVVDSVTRVPLSEVRQLSSRLGESAFAGDPSVPAKTAVRAQKQLYGAIRDELNSHIEETLSKAPELRKELGNVEQLNRDYANLKLLKDVATKRLPREEFQGGSRFSRLMGEAGNKGMTPMGAIVATGSAVSGGASRWAARKLIELSQKAAAGAATYDDIAAVVESGVPRQIAEDVVRRQQSPAWSQP
jgi:hypothetical protein